MLRQLLQQRQNLRQCAAICDTSQQGNLRSIEPEKAFAAVQHKSIGSICSSCAAGLLFAALLSASSPAPALAAIHNEPSNALSLPTWAVHVSSVAEWITAMALFWKYAEVTGNQKWKGMTWGMMPLLGGAFAACTYHFFYNAEEVQFLVVLQASLTVIGNATMGWAAYRIYRDAQAVA